MYHVLYYAVKDSRQGKSGAFQHGVCEYVCRGSYESQSFTTNFLSQIKCQAVTEMKYENLPDLNYAIWFVGNEHVNAL